MKEGDAMQNLGIPPSQETAENPTSKIIVLKAYRFPLRIPAWELWTFFLVFMAFGSIGNLLPRWSGTTGLIGLLAGVLAMLVVAVWRRSGFMAECKFSTGGVQCRRRSGKTFFLSSDAITLLAVEAVFDPDGFSMRRWGRLRVVAGKRRLNLLWSPVGAKQAFQQILALYPNAVGLSGDGEITPPALDGAVEFKAWVKRLRVECRQELHRQIGFAAFFAALLTVSALDFLFVAIYHATLGKVPFSPEFYCLLVVGLLGGAAGYGAVARRRWRLLQKLLKSIDSLLISAPSALASPRHHPEIESHPHDIQITRESPNYYTPEHDGE